jgi:hypothetical protein
MCFFVSAIYIENLPELFAGRSLDHPGKLPE